VPSADGVASPLQVPPRAAPVEPIAEPMPVV
jgi:hypothetical protein